MPSSMLANLLQPAEALSKLKSILPALPKTSRVTENAESLPSLPVDSKVFVFYLRDFSMSF